LMSSYDNIIIRREIMKNIECYWIITKDKIIFTLGRFDDGVINIVDRFEIEDINYKNNKILNVSEFKERMDRELIKLEETFINIDNILSIYDRPTFYKKRYVLSSKEERKIKESDIDNMISLIRNSLEKDGKEIIQIFNSEFYIDDKKVEVPIGEKGKNSSPYLMFLVLKR